MATPVRRRKRRKRRYYRLDGGWTRDMEQTLRRLQPACILCDSTYRLTTDHVRPLARGFGLIPGNAVRLCASCNGRKGSTMLSDLPRATKRKLLAAADAFFVHWARRQRAQNRN